jgi:hypothetical protein
MRPIYYSETSSLYKNTNVSTNNPSQSVYQSISSNYYPSTNFNNNYNYNYTYTRPNSQYDYRTTGIYNGTTYNGMPYYHNSMPYYANVSSSISNQSSVSNNNNFVVGQNALNYSATSGISS